MGAGAAGVAVPAASVEILGGLEAKLLAVKVKGPPKDPEVIFCRLNIAGLGALVKVQTILAKGLRLATGTVIVLPAKVPKLAGLPVVPELVSVHAAVVKVKLLLAASVKVTGLVMTVTELLFTAGGAAVPAAVVVMAGGAPARLVALKVNGPPARPVVIFWMATRGMAGLTILVKAQLIWALTRMKLAGIFSVLPARVPKLPPGFPDSAAFASVQLAETIEKLVAKVSVRLTAVPVALAGTGVVTAG